MRPLSVSPVRARSVVPHPPHHRSPPRCAALAAAHMLCGGARSAARRPRAQRTRASPLRASAVGAQPRSADDCLVAWGETHSTAGSSSTGDEAAAQAEALADAPPLTPAQRLSRSARFWSVILPVFFAYSAWTAQLALPWTSTLISDDDVRRRWDELHEVSSSQLRDVIVELGGFYVKSGQVIGSRPDLFPPPFLCKLRPLQDSLAPMPPEVVAAVVARELGGRPLSSVFSEFDATPVGSASVAQVHRARLRSTGRRVAVKVQRPGVEAVMLGDVANLIVLAGLLKDRTPVDYVVVFTELASQLRNEFDFTREAESMARIGAQLDALPGGAPLAVPRPVAGLVTPRMLVMDFVDGEPLSRLAAEAAAGGGGGGGLGARLAAGALLGALSSAYGAMLLGSGYFHADPHPGNILVSWATGGVALVDYGQTKQLPDAMRLTLARIILLLDAREASLRENGGGFEPADDDARLAAAAVELGVRFRPGLADPAAAAAALALWLFDSTAGAPGGHPLPGGYEAGELSGASPVAAVASFPQSLVMMGRATVLFRGLAARLGSPWSLAAAWAPAARAALAAAGQPLPEGARPAPPAAPAPAAAAAAAAWLWWRRWLPPRGRGWLLALACRAAALRLRALDALRTAAAAVLAAYSPAGPPLSGAAGPSDGCAFTP